MDDSSFDIKHCTTGLMRIFEQNPSAKTKEAFHYVVSKIKAYKTYFEHLNNESGQHTGTIYLLRLIDEVLKKELEKPHLLNSNIKVKDTISCRKGCAHCCRQKVAASQEEVDLILDFCKEQNIVIDTDYLKQQLDLTQETWGLNENYADCVFLDGDQSCKIYEARPSVCRKYLVTSPPELCDIKKYPSGETESFGFIEVEVIASVFPNLAKTTEDLSLSARLYNSLTNTNGQTASNQFNPDSAP